MSTNVNKTEDAIKSVNHKNITPYVVNVQSTNIFVCKRDHQKWHKIRNLLELKIYIYTSYNKTIRSIVYTNVKDTFPISTQREDLFYSFLKETQKTRAWEIWTMDSNKNPRTFCQTNMLNLLNFMHSLTPMDVCRCLPHAIIHRKSASSGKMHHLRLYHVLVHW